MSDRRAISAAAFATLILVALMMAANHVAARLAFNDGLGVASAVVVRSGVTALLVTLLVLVQRVPATFVPRHRLALPAIGLLIGVQSLCLYSSVARLPVALALLAFNTYPLWAALWDWVFYRRAVERGVLLAMPVMLLGLAIALDALGAASGLGAAAQWGRIGVGVAFALAAGATFGMAMVLTQHEAAGLDGRVRTATTLGLASLVALVGAAWQGGLQWPASSMGWGGLAALTFLYGTAFTIMFTVLPKLGVAGNSAIMNVEPVFALGLGWLILDQRVAAMQIAGAFIVVATVMWLGLRKH